MTENSENPSENPLTKILQKLESLESEVQNLNRRIETMENTDRLVPSAPPLKHQIPSLPKVDLPPPNPVTFVPPTQAGSSTPSAADTRPKPEPAPPSLQKRPSGALAPGPLTKNYDIFPPTPPADKVYKEDNSTPQFSKSNKSNKPKETWEVRIASRWLPRIGIVFLALVLILLAQEHVHGPLGKVIASYLLSLGLIGVGLFYEKKYPQWSVPVLAGGLAFSYFATYAVGFVEPFRLLDNLNIKLALLAVNLSVIFSFAQWKKSEATAGTALVLGYMTTGVVGNDIAALCSCVALSIMALLFLWRNQWIVATAVAAAATYIAYFYIWKFVQVVPLDSPAAAFWRHFLFLSLNFVVYVSAGLIARSAALADGPYAHLAAHPFSRTKILALLVQTNITAYIGAMIVVLKTTQVYWNQAWIFFLPLAAICAGLALLFTRHTTIRTTYAFAAVFCFTLGAMAAISPMWLPLFLVLEATVMLAAGGRRNWMLWSNLSFLVLLYGFLYLLSDAWFDLLALSTATLIKFPWWTYAAVSVVILIYSSLAECMKNVALQESVRHSKSDPSVKAKPKIILFPDFYPEILAFGSAILAAIVWRYTIEFFEAPTGNLILGMAVPIVAIASIHFKIRSHIVFILLTMAMTFLSLDLYRNMPSYNNLIFTGMALLGIAGMCTGWLSERQQFANDRVSRFLWRILYIWSQALIVFAIWKCTTGWHILAVYVAIFALSVATGYLARSAALAKSGAITIVGILIWLNFANLETLPLWVLLPSAFLIFVAAYPMCLPFWKRRTGDQLATESFWIQAMVIFIAGIVWSRALTSHGVNPVLAGGFWALLCALAAIIGILNNLAWLSVAFASITAMVLFGRFTDDLSNRYHQIASAAYTIWGLVGVFTIVAAERLLRHGTRLTMPWAHNKSMWISQRHLKLITISIAIGTLVMAITILRMMPELRVFYFTGAMVAAAFVWIVMGFWFNEPVYRKSGFVLLCFGIVKGLVWDVMSLKKTVYRQISWTVLGLLALAASFLYNKFRSRMGNTEHD